MTKKSVTLWNRKLNLDVTFDCYKGEDVLPAQEQALDTLSSTWSTVNDCLGDVKRYCLEEFSDAIGSNHIDNVFKYVMPEALYVPRKQDKRTVALMCNLRPDPEHGLAVVFKNEKLAQIGPQDIVL